MTNTLNCRPAGGQSSKLMSSRLTSGSVWMLILIRGQEGKKIVPLQRRAEWVCNVFHIHVSEAWQKDQPPFLYEMFIHMRGSSSGQSINILRLLCVGVLYPGSGSGGRLITPLVGEAALDRTKGRRTLWLLLFGPGHPLHFESPSGLERTASVWRIRNTEIRNTVLSVDLHAGEPLWPASMLLITCCSLRGDAHLPERTNPKQLAVHLGLISGPGEQN